MANNYSAIKSALLKQYETSEALIMYQMLETHLEARSSITEEQIQEVVEDICQYRPIQYILGSSYFADFEIMVQEGVLIPRPETDELVYWIQKDIKSQTSNLKIWDIGTGSGCIALALKNKNKQAQVFATDISDDALKIAQKNAHNLQLDIQFIKDDILHSNHQEGLPKMNIIVSNPPYILPEEKEEMEAHVLQFEPHTALFVNNEDPLQFYKAIESVARLQLEHNGTLYLELHSRFAKETQLYYESKGWSTVLKQDMQGKDRMLKCIMEI